MKSRITPYYIALIQDATLKSFWRKNALRMFLRQCKITETFLATWNEDESKRDFLVRLFKALPQSDKGRDTLIRIADFLSEQSCFPDLENWEESEDKIRQAHNSVQKLRAYHREQEAELNGIEDSNLAKTKFSENQKKVASTQSTFSQLNSQLTELFKELGTQKGGYSFQNWFYALMDFYEIQNRKPYTHDGRQIDGSITLSGTTYLIELKFTSSQSDATDIDSFYRKVTTKADNTMGIFISISGYSKIAIKEASSSRTPLLLLDHSHIYLALSGIMSFSEIIERVRRHASQTGEAYLCSNEFSL